MATFSLSDTSRRAQATGDGSNVTFAFSFQVNATSDVKVYIGDTLKTLSTHYTIVDSSDAAGLNANGTGTVKFITSPTDYTPANGDVVTILSDVPVARTSVYTSGGNITAAALESDFDTQAMMLGDREERETRTVMAPVNDPTDVNMVLPAKADRLGKALGFNSSTGNPEAVSFYDSAADVRAAVEAASDSNVFTDADHSKLNAVEANATGDQTAAEIRAAVEAATDSNVFTDADHSKLDGIEGNSTADQTKADIDALNINADLLDGQHGSYYTGYADTAVSNLVDSAPSTLDTLNELAAALGDDANFSTTVTNSIATKMPLAGGTFTGDVTFDGTSYNVIWDESANALRADANAEFWLGSGGNTKLYHNGSNSYIDNYTGHVFITNYSDNKDILIKTDNGDGGSTNYFLAKGQSGEALLYHYGSEKLSTKSTGIDITGNIVVSGTVDGVDIATRDAVLTSTTTTANAAMPTTGGTFSGDVTFADNEYAKFGNGADLWIGHSDIPFQDEYNAIIAHSYDLKITNITDDRDVIISTDDGSGSFTEYFRADGSTGETLLYHYGSEKIKTKSYGAQITGDVVVTGTVDGVDIAARDAILTSTTTTANAAMPKSGGTFTGDINFEGATANDYETTVTVTDPTADRTITLPDATGTVLLSDSDGSNLTNVEASKVYINEVSDSLNNTDLNVLFSDTSGSGNVQMQPQQDDGGLTFNPDQNILKVNNFQVDDVSAKSSNSHLYLRNLHDNFGVIIQADNGSGGATNYFKADGSTGEAVLYHYGNSKLKTQSGGVDVTGNITVSGDIDLSGAITEDVYVVTLGSGTHPIEPSDDGGIFYMTVSANCSLGVSNLANGQSQVLMIDDGNGYTITWPTMTWINNGGSAPTLSTTARTTVVVWKANNVVYGALVGDGT